jgi:hypothetical protein
MAELFSSRVSTTHTHTAGVEIPRTPFYKVKTERVDR